MALCFTDTPLHEFEYQWVIKKFSVHLQCSRNEKKSIIIRSSTFSIGNPNQTTWHKKLDLHGSTHPDKDFIGIYTYYESVETTPMVWVSGEYFIVDATKKCSKLNSYPLTKFHAAANGLGFSRLIEKKMFSGQYANFYLPNDELTILFRMTVIGDPIAVGIPNCPIPIVAINSLLDDYAKLYLNERFSDVTFILGGTHRIPAHKIILVARSPVFAAFFEQRGIEGGEITVAIINPGTFKRMLRYIYTNEMPILDDDIIYLMAAADSYGLKELKEICVNHLCNNITVHNVMVTSMFAERHNAPRLLELVQAFIQMNMNGMLVTTESLATIDPCPPVINLQ